MTLLVHNSQFCALPLIIFNSHKHPGNFWLWLNSSSNLLAFLLHSDIPMCFIVLQIRMYMSPKQLFMNNRSSHASKILVKTHNVVGR